MMLRQGLYILAAAVSTANAITIAGFPSQTCGGRSVATCNGILESTCCPFPRGGLQVDSAYFSLIYSGSIGVFYQSQQTQLCNGPSRDTEAGPLAGPCLSGGQVSRYFGGGAAWLDCVNCVPAKRDSSEGLAVRTCNSTNLPTMLSWEGEGAWVLDPLEGQAWDRYNELPVTTDLNVHRENLKSFGATWYENARDHPVAAELLAEE